MLKHFVYTGNAHLQPLFVQATKHTTPVYLHSISSSLPPACLCWRWAAVVLPALQNNMVLLHLKNSDVEQFLYETTVQSAVSDVVRELAEVYNLRHRIQRLKLEGGELAKYGPSKHPDKQGIDTYQEEPVHRGQHYNMDPTGRRNGDACDPEIAKKLLTTLDEAEAIAHKDQVARKVTLTAKRLREAIDLIRGAVMICYPMGLPEWDFVRQCLEEKEDLAGSNFGGEDLDPSTSTLWFAGKQMAADKKLCDYLGRNDRTKVVVRLQKKGQGAPGREPVVDADTQKAMLAWYYKKQEEQKALHEDDDDSYVSSVWANTKSLKQHFSGVGSVRIPR